MFLLLVFSGAGVAEVLFTDRTQADAIAAPINAEAGPGDLVIFCPDQLGPAGDRAVTADVEIVSYPRLDDDPRFVDWADYEARNLASDPVAFAEAALTRAGEGRIWFVSSDEYRTLEGKCSAVQAELQRARPRGGLVVAENGNDFFEHAGLVRLDPPR